MKAYWIAHVDVTNPEQYQQYTQRAPAAFKHSAAASWHVAGAVRRWKGGQPRSVAW